MKSTGRVASVAGHPVEWAGLMAPCGPHGRMEGLWVLGLLQLLKTHKGGVEAPRAINTSTHRAKQNLTQK